MPKSPLLIAPSLLSADIFNLGREIEDVTNAGADWLHFDVMDGHFVPNLTFGLHLLEVMKGKTKLPIDAHIMIDNPDAMAIRYAKAGAAVVTFHTEVAKHPHRIVQELQGAGAKAGVAINPGTAVESILPLLPFVDLVLVMSVNPGFGGQSFIPEVCQKIQRISNELKTLKRDEKVFIEVDGGITPATAPAVVKAGANVLVAGSAVFGQPNRQQAIAGIRQGCGH
jgi:ribulose-phosphate 3-epimerase